MKHIENRPGFALPMAVVILVFLTVGVATAYTRVQSEVRTSQDREADTEAFLYAQTGLERFAADRRGYGFTVVPPAVVESTRIALPRGYVDVVSRRVRPKTVTSSAVYLIKAKGVYQAGSMSWMPRSEHMTTQYTQFREGSMQVLSAWTSLSGLHKNGGAGSIDGNDACGAAPAVAGVAVPDNPGYTQSGGASVPAGSPPVDSLGTQTETNAAVKIDWDGIVNHNALPADYTIPPDAFPTGTYGSSNWPITRVNGDFALPADGQGTLIVTGNLTIGGTEKWKGILLVGGTIYANGNNNVQGAVISGLNEKLGIAVPQSDIGNGTKTYVYNSCAITSALARYGAHVMLPKSWSNSWPTW